MSDFDQFDADADESSEPSSTLFNDDQIDLSRRLSALGRAIDATDEHGPPDVSAIGRAARQQQIARIIAIAAAVLIVVAAGILVGRPGRTSDPLEPVASTAVTTTPSTAPTIPPTEPTILPPKADSSPTVNSWTAVLMSCNDEVSCMTGLPAIRKFAPGAVVVVPGTYESLRLYWVIAAGRFETGDEAAEFCRANRLTRADCFGRYLSQDPEDLDENAFPEPGAEVKADVNLRAGPSLDTTVVGRVPGGAVVPMFCVTTGGRAPGGDGAPISSTTDDTIWFHTNFEDQMGWVTATVLDSTTVADAIETLPHCPSAN